MNQVQTDTGDANNEAGWQYAGMFSGGKAIVGVRTAGLKGVMSAWRDPGKIIVG